MKFRNIGRSTFDHSKFCNPPFEFFSSWYQISKIWYIHEASSTNFLKEKALLNQWCSNMGISSHMLFIFRERFWTSFTIATFRFFPPSIDHLSKVGKKPFWQILFYTRVHSLSIADGNGKIIAKDWNWRVQLPYFLLISLVKHFYPSLHSC